MSVLPHSPAAHPLRLQRAWPPMSVAIGGAFLVLVVLCALAPALLAPTDPALIEPAQALQRPSGVHLLGTDALGRDVLSRVVSGARSAIVGPLIVTGATVLVSTVLSLIAGYLGGWVDQAVGRIVDAIYALPALIVTIVVAGVFGGGYWLAIGLLTLFNTPTVIRILRAAVIERRDLPYIEATRMLGVRSTAIMFRHLLPNLEPLIATCLFLGFTYGMVELSALSFLGIGIPPGSPDWGRMLAENRAQVFANPWATLGPGLALVGTVVSGNLVGDWVYSELEGRRAVR